MKVVRRILKLRKIRDGYRKKGQSLGFVPTMGFLHEGHLSLVSQAKKENDKVIVSIFVNPTQFSPNEDLSKYPRDLEKDKRMLLKEGVDVLFCPEVSEMYEQKAKGKNQKSKVVSQTGFVIVPPDYLVNCLCGVSRLTHFRGVATIVAKLFNIIQPDRAYFGQKDYQQVLVIKKMVSDLKFGVKIVMCPTVREKDGLARSSRNVYLTTEERKKAMVLYRTLLEAKRMVEEVCYPRVIGDSVGAGFKPAPTEIVVHCHNLIEQELLAKVDYFEIRDAEDLSEVKKWRKGQKIVITGAIWIGKTRLIDNVVL